MAIPRPDTLFRIGALVGCGIIALPYVTRAAAAPPAAPGAGPLLVYLLAVAAPAIVAAVFGAAFWLNSRGPAAGGRRGVTLGLLALQVAIGLTVSDYFFLIAAEAPFVFAPRGALVWLAGQLAAFAALVVVVAMSGEAYAIPEIAGMPDTIAIPVTIASLGGWQVFAFSIGYLAAAEQRSRRELQQRARDLLATQQMLADSSRVAERAAISRELHDTLGHSLTVLNVNLELARHLTQGSAADAVVKAQTVGRMLLADVRELVHTGPEERAIDAIDLGRALRTLAQGAEAPEIHLTVPDDLRIDDPAAAHAVFRCVQEAVTNAIRHAGARHVWIELTQDAGGVDVHIRDDGHGAAGAAPGYGLTGMRQRLEAVDGRLRVPLAEARGFALHAWVPATRARS